MMKTIHRIIAMTLLLCVLLGGQSLAAENAPLFQYGWEDWEISSSKGENGVWQYSMTCPENDVPMEALQNYVLDIMTYCKAANPAPTSVTMRFPYPSFVMTEVASAFQQAVGPASGLKAITSPFLNFSSIRMKNGASSTEAILVLDVNNPYSASSYSKEIPFGTSLDVARAIAADIAARTSDPGEQVILINDYLIKNVSYYHEYTGVEFRVHSIVGALLDGKAMCAGYTSAVSALCHLLNIPCYQIDDKVNRHTWNVVKIDGAWLMVDATFNDTGNGKGTTDFLLRKDFGADYHDYTDALRARLESYSERLWSEQAAAERLYADGILQGRGSGEFALSQPLTYSELAIVLARLDGIESNRLTSAATIDNCPAWAAPYVVYCVDAGYLDNSVLGGVTDHLSTREAEQILLNYFAGSISPMMAVLATETEIESDTTVLRGEFFERLVTYFE